MERNAMERAKEADLVRRLRARDPLALAELYDQYGTFVFRAALATVRDREAAENLTQETFLYLWNRIGGFDARRGTLARWIAIVARCRALDYVRSAEFRMARRAAPIEAARACADLSRTEDLLTQAEHARLLREPWQRLRDCERHALGLAYYAGLSQTEIALRMQRPLGTVKTWMRSGLESLRAALEGASAF